MLVTHRPQNPSPPDRKQDPAAPSLSQAAMRLASPVLHHHWGAHRKLPVPSMGIVVALLTSLFPMDSFPNHGSQQVKSSTQRVFPETRKPGTVQWLHEVYCGKLSRISVAGAVE